MERQWTGDEAQIRSGLAAPLNLDNRGEYTTGPAEGFLYNFELSLAGM